MEWEYYWVAKSGSTLRSFFLVCVHKFSILP